MRGELAELRPLGRVFGVRRRGGRQQELGLVPVARLLVPVKIFADQRLDQPVHDDHAAVELGQGEAAELAERAGERDRGVEQAGQR